MTRSPGLSALLLVLAASGCDTAQGPCYQSCPDISGMYAIDNTVPVGECGFSPYLLSPSVRIEQGSMGRQATFYVIDPTTQLEVALSGDVYGPTSTGTGELGSFRIDSRTTRLAQRTSSETVTLEVVVTGSVSRVSGRRMLTATLNTTDLTNSQGCTTTLSVTGQGQ